MDSNGKIVIEGFDWGPAVTKVILNASPNSENRDEPDKTLFEVTEIKMNDKKSFSGKRIVTDAYYSDESGNRDGNKCDFITLELKVSPDEGSPMYNDMQTSYNKWFDYTLEVKSSDGRESKLNNENFFFPETKGVDLSGKFTGSEGHTLTYAFYRPANASKENLRPLVIWMHGMGEGGTDPLVTLYGNKVVALFGEEFQNTMDGAYVLTPQTPTFWLQYKEDTASWQKNKGQDSIYLKDVKELIDKFADDNFVDKNRIIVGGCSNGGFMTMDLIINYPGYFAAAYPICEAFYPKRLKKEQLLPLKDMPIWFVYAKNDFTVLPVKYEKPLLKMFGKIGAGNIIVSEFEDVHDTSGNFKKDGKPFQYFGHFSWIYFFNNDCVENGVSIWEWMSKQTK
ncbi:MAG: prolyl oligopeptidase family serine peptidase [Lachnospiraceae bacterium]|nr:prolyl oligopeptidase family serine peptidase [Lachnospiraceae bacterium]